jgi:FlaA1/EpsC-like NDP-sugar epimerase
MTIPEAAQLVLHAAAMAQDGDIYVLDMGSPIKILDLAKKMVALAGLTIRDTARPEGDIEIRFTGLRPGEKLYEELLIGEHPMSTSHPRIIRAREDFMRWAALDVHLHNLFEAIRCGDAPSMKRTLQLLVPGYAPTPYAKTQADQEAAMNGLVQGVVHENR